MTNTKKSWKDIKPVLSEFSSTQLLGLVQDLYRFSDQNALFMNARFLSEGKGQDHLVPYKKRIQKAICPKEPWKQDVRLAEGRKAINEFKKANGDILTSYQTTFLILGMLLLNFPIESFSWNPINYSLSSGAKVGVDVTI